MKITQRKYPEEKNWELWLNFVSGKEVNLVFLYRVANYIKNEVGKKCSVYGYRGFIKQLELYNLYKAGKGNIAAAPGKSRHNYGLAIDFNNIGIVNKVKQYPGTLNADYALWLKGKPEVLNKYGLRHAVKGEIWHIESIETVGVTIDNIKWFPDIDDFVNTSTGYPTLELTEPYTQSAAVRYLQQCIGADDDGTFGPDTDEALKKYQTLKKLTADGVAGTGTWTAILADMTPPDYEALYKAEQSKNAILAKANADIEAEKVNELIIYNKEIAELEEKYNSIQKEIKTKQSEIDSLQISLKDKDTRIVNMEYLIDDSTEKMQVKDDELAESYMRQDAIVKELDDTQSTLHDKEEEIIRITVEHNICNSSLANQKAINETIKNELNATRETLESVQMELEEIKNSPPDIEEPCFDTEIPEFTVSELLHMIIDKIFRK